MCRKVVRVSRKVLQVNFKRPLSRRVVSVQYIPQLIDLVSTNQINIHSLQQIARDTAICEVSSLAIQTAIILINIKRVQDALKSKE